MNRLVNISYLHRSPLYCMSSRRAQTLLAAPALASCEQIHMSTFELAV